MAETADHALYGRFLRGLAAAPNGEAIRLATDVYSYTELHELASTWAGALLNGPAGKPKAVGVLAGKSIEAYAGILAGLYAGITVVPLQPEFPPARTRQIVDAAGVDAMIVDEKGHSLLPAIFEGHPGVPVLAPNVRAPGLLTASPAGALTEPVPVEASDVAYVLFTSGSTGRPKGVPVTHANTHHYFGLLDERYDFTPDDVFSQTFDLNFDCGWFDLFCAWGTGANLTVVPPRAYRDLPAFIAERGLTVWFSTPSAIALIRKMGGLTPGSMPGLRWSFFAGEALTLADADDWQVAADSSTLENLYGPTELTITVTGHRFDRELSPQLGVNGGVPIGTVHSGHDHLLIDTDENPVEGDEGELCISGPQMATGYLDPADDEGRFLKHGGQLWYRTGDRVRRLADGQYVYLGRLDAQVQVQGWRVELAEIDHAVRSCDGVLDAVTVAADTGDGLELFVFYTGTERAPVELNRELRVTLPSGMVPKHYRHVDEFPLNSNRKTDRKELSARASSLVTAGR
ncbi:amino acid adenylation domain-containing protein [Herbihabitans rhizosphaerae]|uniref:Amino acid adenylation domain-containing protein n=1 Tax=Herbihabitans rhizosphaerae TaxID=1872711 RepID=A0A4Q7KFQ3_9PSEU|nr:AMP-binding protein [Herbihabitans rhizosphaerae]RZS32712.1 amino acid adenylation domain-containing protein [Herbihabitans rhizosphaerae]